MSKRSGRTRQTLLNKFRFAVRGVRRGVHSESNFFVHLLVTAGVIAAGSILKCSTDEWCLLVLAISTVLAAEMMNTAIEHLAKAITDRHNPLIGDALDIASASVLIALAGAVTVGVVVLLGKLVTMLDWWPK